jgi:hypothetical protein
MNPRIGRFHTMDTYAGDQQDPLSLHKYIYCHGNPVSNTDPSGRAVYVVTRPLNVPVLNRTPKLSVHVYLAFDEIGITDYNAWHDAVVESCNADRHPNLFGDYYGINASLVTFSFHPRSVGTGNSSENSAVNIVTPGSYVAYSDGLDLRSFNKTGSGFKQYQVVNNQALQLRIYASAVRSRDSNNNGTPDPAPYESTFVNCGTWVQYILDNNGVAFPDLTINQGVGLYKNGTPMNRSGIAAYALTKGWIDVKSVMQFFIDFSPLL